MTANSKSGGALDGVKILAFEQVLSGPFATCLLADMGAQPATLESDLVRVAQSNDTTPPTSTITSGMAATLATHVGSF